MDGSAKEFLSILKKSENFRKKKKILKIKNYIDLNKGEKISAEPKDFEFRLPIKL